MKRVKARPPAMRSTRLAARTHVIEAARRFFFRVGYTRATMDGLAAEAGVAVQTLYNLVGNKAALLGAVFEQMASGPQAPRPVPEFMAERTAAAPDAATVMRVFADWFVEVHERMAPLWRVIDEAAASDEAMGAFARERAHRRLFNYQQGMKQLARRGGLRAGLRVDEAAAVVWSIGHPGVYRTLVLELGWPIRRYRRWVEDALAAALLPAGASAATGRRGSRVLR